MKKTEPVIKRIAGFLLVLFVGYVGSVTFFYHTHDINGAHITHSHPYSDIPDTGKHTHTSSEFTAIAALSVLLMLTAFSYSFVKIFTAKEQRVSGVTNCVALGRISPVIFFRGPPPVC